MKLTTIMMIGALSLASAETLAGRSYTPSQLNSMTARGIYPPQGRIEQEKVTKMRFHECKIWIDTLGATMARNYPVRLIVNTSQIKAKKYWTNTGVVLATCYSHGEFKLTTSSYK